MPTSSTSLSFLGREALAYASRGILIFPLWHVIRYPGQDGPAMCACSAAQNCGSPGKHPRTRAGLNEASSDERTIEQWWTRWPDANIGMLAGANGLAIVDVDPGHGGTETLRIIDLWCVEKHGVDIMATRAIRTGSGGLHLIYWQPAGGIPSKRQAFGDDAPGIDTRGRGGYVVAPPSLHASGHRYEVIDNGHTIAPWPAPLTELLEQAPAPAPIRPFRVLVTGSRTWAHPAPITGALDALLNIHGDALVVVHGACPRGADNIADRWCHQNNVTAERHPADWSTGRAAGHQRNATMVNTRPDICLAFIENNSPGATGCAILAEKAGIPTYRNVTSRDFGAITAVRPAAPAGPVTGIRGNAWALAALNGELAKLAELPLGEGNGKNAALNEAALKLGRRVGGGWLDENAVTEALYSVAAQWIGHGHTDRSICATIRSGLAAGMRQPHRGPATRGGESR